MSALWARLKWQHGPFAFETACRMAREALWGP